MCKRKGRLRFFKCPTCGAIITAPKLHGITHVGHLKTMYCFVCGTNRDFIQVDSDRIR